MTTRIVISLLIIAAEALTACCSAQQIESQQLKPVLKQTAGVWTADYTYKGRTIAASGPDSAVGLEIRVQDEPHFHPVEFRHKKNKGHIIILGPAKVGPLVISLEIEQVGPTLIRRTMLVTAKHQAKYTARWSISPVGEGVYSTFTQEEKTHTVFDTTGGGPEFPDVHGETFPAALLRTPDYVLGVLADSPGNWENRCLIELDPVGKRLAVLCGDGSGARDLRIKYDARDTYLGKFDGWQSIEAGDRRRFDTWIFASPARSHYDAQLAAHLALANAKGWNSSALEAIMRNTSYLLLRRNLLREDHTEEGRYIFISGIGYGWKQWVSDGFWQAVALDDSEKLTQAQKSVFLNRITYEDNAQYYLIWAVLSKRRGLKPNMKLVREAYDFIHSHETNGIFYPPPLPGSPKPKGWKTYFDLLEYDDDDAPVSDQGFQCGALMAARELGMPVTSQDISRAITAYRGMFNSEGGYFPTSIKQRTWIGQDALYGEALTYAVFGVKLLEDNLVLKHWRKSQQISSPFGLRVISNEDGSLLKGHSGEYVFGGSWFLVDSANHLLAGLHGLPQTEVDNALIKRITTELAYAPAFNESINTLTGRPQGHILYSWNSGYWWLRQQFRKRMHQTTPDPVADEIDKRLGVVHDSSGLHLEPDHATLRPVP